MSRPCLVSFLIGCGGSSGGRGVSILRWRRNSRTSRYHNEGIKIRIKGLRLTELQEVEVCAEEDKSLQDSRAAGVEWVAGFYFHICWPSM